MCLGGMQHYVPRLQGAQEKKLDNDMEEAIVTNATAAEGEGASGRRSASHHRKEGKKTQSMPPPRMITG